jgi:ABC-type bacteriocin/lantibiotic exporter with double-glycine peptidase domain
MSASGERRVGAGEIVFDHVTKRYPGRSGAAVADLSLTIPAGETRS